jgi:hypothetical protein
MHCSKQLHHSITSSARLHNSSQTQQAWPEPRYPHHQGPVTPPQPQTLRRSSQDNVELVTQKEVLNFKPASRLEQIGDKCSEQVDDRKHRIG